MVLEEKSMQKVIFYIRFKYIFSLYHKLTEDNFSYNSNRCIVNYI